MTPSDNIILDSDYFIKDCKNCEKVKIVSIDKITIDKMYCGITDNEITNSKKLCEHFKISESCKIVNKISDEEAEKIEKKVR